MRSRLESGGAALRFLLRAFSAIGRRGDSGFFIRVPEYTSTALDLDPHNQEMRMKQILGVVAGFVLWSVLWLGCNQLLLMLGLLAPMTTEPVTDPKPLLVLLVASVLISLVTGYVTARIVGFPWALPVAALGVLLLATGIFFQVKVWYLMPLWYHLTFLLLLIPVTFVGARVRAPAPGIASSPPPEIVV
jgi:hypothetical protein